MAKYDLGDEVRCTGTFTDPNNSNAAVDPTVVKVSVRNPASTVTTYTYLTDAAVIKSATGIYYIDVDASSAGRWYYRWFSTGTGKAAEEESFTVEQPQAV